MSQIIKVYLSLFMITVFVVLGVSLIGADTGVSNARAYHDSFVKQIEESLSLIHISEPTRRS
mgnify:CR=1 FL=1